VALTLTRDSLADIHPRAREVFDLAQTGATWRLIASKTAMTEGAVYLVVRSLRAAGLLEPRSANKARGPANRVDANISRSTKLKCLCCREVFQSADRRSNRICRRCKGNAA
jgi:hypothetical protein